MIRDLTDTPQSKYEIRQSVSPRAQLLLVPRLGLAQASSHHRYRQTERERERERESIVFSVSQQGSCLAGRGNQNIQLLGRNYVALTVTVLTV